MLQCGLTMVRIRGRSVLCRVYKGRQLPEIQSAPRGTYHNYSCTVRHRVPIWPCVQYCVPCLYEWGSFRWYSEVAGSSRWVMVIS